jgi:hypothetical protein
MLRDSYDERAIKLTLLFAPCRLSGSYGDFKFVLWSLVKALDPKGGPLQDDERRARVTVATRLHWLAGGLHEELQKSECHTGRIRFPQHIANAFATPTHTVHLLHLSLSLGPSDMEYAEKSWACPLQDRAPRFDGEKAAAEISSYCPRRVWWVGNAPFNVPCHPRGGTVVRAAVLGIRLTGACISSRGTRCP